jgi:mitotic spindle assembly checkpoint protein MAD2
LHRQQQEEMSNAQAVSNVITLRGSTDIVTEFFDFSVNGILYQRGIYPPESFKKIPKYGLSMMTTTDEGLAAYMANVLRQLDGERRTLLTENCIILSSYS